MSMFSSANSNYPAGVTDAHEHFNPVETTMEVSCDDGEAPIVPSHELKERLKELADQVARMLGGTTSEAVQQLPAVHRDLKNLLDRVEELEDHGEFDCTFEGDVEVQITDNGATAEWTCPVCGQGHSEDVGEDDDPDRARDEARDREYD